MTPVVELLNPQADRSNLTEVNLERFFGKWNAVVAHFLHSTLGGVAVSEKFWGSIIKLKSVAVAVLAL